MKWSEPWKISIREQDKYNIFSKQILLSCIRWVCFFLLFMVLISAIQLKFHFNSFLYAPILGVCLALFLYTVTWASPLKVSSGPNGIVLDKGDRLGIIHWEKIDGYKIEVSEKFNKLTLIIENTPDKRGLFLPKKIDIESIKKEIDENI